MSYKRYKMLQKYINGEPQEEYKQGELISNTEYSTLEECNEGNQNPDTPIEGEIYQWVTISGEYVCSGYDKYTKEKEQRSSDNGATWTDTGRTRQGSLMDDYSEDCGYEPPIPPTTGDYLTFVARESGTFTFTPQNSNVIYYSTDNGTTWTEGNSVSVNNGEKVLWKGTMTPTTNGIGTFSATGKFNVQGNAMSLLYGDNFIGQTDLTGKNYAFYRLFYQNTKVINAKNLSLPATTLAEGCYYSMFRDCTSLMTAPELPATTLAYDCYGYMFDGCTSLTTAPVLPATTLAERCYYSMFYGCTSLTTAPSVLPATTLTNRCYSYMFNGCRNLTTAPSLPATTLAGSCYDHMFYGCTSLTTAPELPATTLASTCYSGMFSRCTSLTTAPELPATTLAESCYQDMFAACTNLTTAPELPATTLASTCYSGMFRNCRSLTTAPVLPATTLADRCYNSMFGGCTNLNYIKAMFTTTPSASYTSYWVNGVAATGTFVKNSNATWNVTGTNGIPSGWTVVTE